MSQVKEIAAAQFAERVLQSEQPVVVDFFADWCGPCKMIAPLLTELAAERDDVTFVKIDADISNDLLSQYGIRGLPTLLIFNQGKVVASKVGAISLVQLREFVAQV